MGPIFDWFHVLSGIRTTIEQPAIKSSRRTPVGSFPHGEVGPDRSSLLAIRPRAETLSRGVAGAERSERALYSIAGYVASSCAS